MWIEGAHREGWPERVAWASFSGGMLGVLLVCLLVWVERLDSDRPDVAAPPPAGLVVVEVEPARAEPRIPRREPSVSVPLSAVLRTAEGREPYCYVVEAGPRAGVARARRLVLGEVAGSRVEVRGGLAPGEAVLVRGQHEVVDGTALVVESAALDAWPVAAHRRGR
jgi:hypothetical protein